jgi:CheY-like chemotaxis protein
MSDQLLLVDDSPDDVELARAVLADYWPADKIVVVRDGAEACDYLQRQGEHAGRPAGNPALILLDIKMPRMDGLELLRTVKTDDRLKVIPVIMLTSSREDRDVHDSYRHGCNGYIVKPLVYGDFCNAIKNLSAFWFDTNVPPPAAA